MLVARARIFYAQKKYDEAALLAQRAIERKPDCEGAWNILGRAYFASGRYEEAAALTERAIECQRRRLQHLYSISPGDWSASGGRKMRSICANIACIKVLRQQLELVPEDVRARILLATTLAAAKENAEEAMRHLQTAVALRPGDANTLYNAACCYGVLGEKADALETIKKAFAAGYGNRAWAAQDTDLDTLHGDPEFQKLVARSEGAAT